MKQAFEAGVDDYISKPFNIDELRMRVKTGERIINLENEHSNLAHILMESRNKLEVIFDSLSAEFVILNDRFIIESANKPFAVNHGLEFKKLIGVSAFDLDRDLFGAESRRAIEAVFESGVPTFFYCESRERKGRLWLKTFTACRLRMGRRRFPWWLFRPGMSPRNGKKPTRSRH